MNTNREDENIKTCAFCGTLVSQEASACPKCGRGIFDSTKDKLSFHTCLKCESTTDDGDYYSFKYQYKMVTSHGGFLTGEYTKYQWIGSPQEDRGFLCSFCSTDFLLQKRRHARLITTPLFVVLLAMLIQGVRLSSFQNINILFMLAFAGLPLVWILKQELYTHDNLRSYCGDLVGRLAIRRMVATGTPNTLQGIPLSNLGGIGVTNKADIARFNRLKDLVKDRPVPAMSVVQLPFWKRWFDNF